MRRSYLRMLVSSTHEIPFVRMNILESVDFVDEILVCEANTTHTGTSRELIFGDILAQMSVPSTVKYVPLDISRASRSYDGTSETLHYNEQLIRDEFRRHVKLRPDDIVISVDADEIVFRQHYPRLLQILSRTFPPNCIHLKMHQFVYLMNYLWSGYKWRAPVAARAEVFLSQKTPQWRDQGWRSSKFVGAHFAWVMSPEDMAAKILRYSHRRELEHLADPQVLKHAVESHRYVFDPSADFQVTELSRFDPIYQPASLLEIQDDYAALFSKAWAFSNDTGAL